MSRYRECDVCNRELGADTPGRICFICADRIRRDMPVEDTLHYGVKELRVLLGYGCDESVRRLGRKGEIPGRGPNRKRHLYFKKDVDDWIASGGQRPPTVKKPTNPLQEEAHALCSKGDHSWFGDERFDGHAYKTETVSGSQTGYVVTVGYKRTCYFCGLAKEIPL